MDFNSSDKIYYYITTFFLFLMFFVLIRTAYLKLKQGYFSVAFPVVGAMFFFLGLPIILDILFGSANYENYRGFSYAMQNLDVAIYYNLYVTYAGLVFYYYIKRMKTMKFIFDTENFYSTIYKYRYLLWGLMLLPILGVLISVRPSVYLEYQAILLNRDQAFKDSHLLVSRFALLSTVAGSFLFYFLGKKKDYSLALKYILFFLLLILSIWIDGKRGIFFKFFFVFIVAGLLLGKIKPKKIMLYVVYGLVVLSSIVMLYGKDFSTESSYSRGMYTSLRVNIGRDQTIKYTLYKEYVENEMILEYRGQSFLYGAVFFVPRSLWSDKPYPYAVYFVTSVLNLPPEPIGWSFTTCILEEFISNLGFIGLIIAPFFLLWICKVGDKTRNKFLTIVAIVCGVFFLFTQMAAFMPIIVLFLILLIKDKFRNFKMS